MVCIPNKADHIPGYVAKLVSHSLKFIHGESLRSHILTDKEDLQLTLCIFAETAPTPAMNASIDNKSFQFLFILNLQKWLVQILNLQ